MSAGPMIFVTVCMKPVLGTSKTLFGCRKIADAEWRAPDTQWITTDMVPQDIAELPARYETTVPNHGGAARPAHGTTVIRPEDIQCGWHARPGSPFQLL